MSSNEAMKENATHSTASLTPSRTNETTTKSESVPAPPLGMEEVTENSPVGIISRVERPPVSLELIREDQVVLESIESSPRVDVVGRVLVDHRRQIGNDGNLREGFKER